MNKIQAVSIALLAISAATSAQAAGVGGGTLGAASSIAVPSATCTGLKEDVTIQLSANNFGYIDCPSATASGAAVGNGKGKGKAYSASSSGGAIVETTIALPTSGADLSGPAQTASALATSS